MRELVCPACRNKSYTAATTKREWTCPHCGALIASEKDCPNCGAAMFPVYFDPGGVMRAWRCMNCGVIYQEFFEEGQKRAQFLKLFKNAQSEWGLHGKAAEPKAEEEVTVSTAWEGEIKRVEANKAMTPERFASLCEEFIAREKELLGLKAGEYATGGDRLWNFHAQGALEGRRPSEIALTHFLKHVLSLVKAVREGSGVWAWEAEKGEGLKQRVADARNYLLLLAACLEEERHGAA